MFTAAAGSRNKSQAFIAAAIYAAAALLFYLPLLPRLNHVLIGPAEDNTVFYWLLWYGSHAVWEPDWALMFTRQMYFPEGTSLYFANYYYYGVFITAVLKFFLSVPLIFNLLILHTYVLAGLGAYLLIRYLIGHHAAALVGGFVYAFSPQHVAQSLHHIQLANTQFIPFYALFMIKACREGRKRHLAAAWFFLVLTALASWNLFVCTLLLTLAGALWAAASRRDRFFRTVLWRMAAVWLAAGLALLPLLVPMMRLDTTGSIKRLEGHDIYVADLAAFFLPHAYHLSARWEEILAVNLRFPGNIWEGAVYLGAVNILMIAWASRRIGRAGLKYAGGLLFFMLIAMGTSVHFMGHGWDLPMPYDILEALPFFSHARNPARMSVGMYLFWAILSALAFKKLFFSAPFTPRRRAGLVAAVLAVFMDYYTPVTAATPVQLPAAYEVIRSDPEPDFGVLEIPWEAGRHLLYQTLHGRPVVQGYLGRRSEQSLVNRLAFDLENLPQQRDQLWENRVKYLVLYKTRFLEDEEKTRQSAYNPAPDALKFRFIMQKHADAYGRVYDRVYEDDEMAVFRVY